MHGMEICPVWGFCECGSDLHRSVQDASYTVTWPMLWDMTFSHRCDEDYALSTGEGLQAF